VHRQSVLYGKNYWLVHKIYFTTSRTWKVKSRFPINIHRFLFCTSKKFPKSTQCDWSSKIKHWYIVQCTIDWLLSNRLISPMSLIGEVRFLYNFEPIFFLKFNYLMFFSMRVLMKTIQTWLSIKYIIQILTKLY
jgi:hypothetical protein